MLVCTIRSFFEVGLIGFVAGLVTPFLIVGIAQGLRKRK